MFQQPATGDAQLPICPVEGDSKITVHQAHSLSEGWTEPSDIMLGRLTEQSLT